MPNATAMLNTLLRWNVSRHNTIAGWVVTGLILFFATTTLAQTFVRCFRESFTANPDFPAFPSGAALQRDHVQLSELVAPRSNIIGKPHDLALNFFSKTRWNRSFQLVRAYPL